ncbi:MULTISPECIES: helix-turn-helix domain-containing protein [Chryseobacterium]|uniref:Helix-turn-helix n=1 Tax=Chryseobacterium gambrini TaxID=373672 RepID=A0A1N7LGJ0_9FLAO|nr:MULTISPECIES: helix-turn-helix transcriptional regulator [Chryseobacterium]SIS72927.1 Helix-turn-helix [Chryseobacterium gambrini]
MSEFNLSEQRKKLGLTQQELADELKLSRKTINNYEKSGNIPDSVRLLIRNFFELRNENGLDNVTKRENLLLPKDGVKLGIPFYNVDFAGGWSSEVLFSEVRPDFYINNPEFDKAEFACNLIGHSISRRIPHRSIIGLRLIEDWQTYFPTNELYGIVMKNELRTVKIVKRSKEKEGYLTLIPDPLPEFNQTQYEPEEVPIEFVSRFYQLIAWAQFERISM